jgi:hypothetical protein
MLIKSKSPRAPSHAGMIRQNRKVNALVYIQKKQEQELRLYVEGLALASHQPRQISLN